MIVTFFDWIYSFKLISSKLSLVKMSSAWFQLYILFIVDSSAGVSDDDDVDGCDVVAVGVATTSESVGDLITELSASVSSSINAWTFEKTPRRAKLSKNSVPVFNMISSSIFSTTKCPSSSSYFQNKKETHLNCAFSVWFGAHNTTVVLITLVLGCSQNNNNNNNNQIKINKKDINNNNKSKQSLEQKTFKM